MFGDYFYNESLRKIIVAFGTLFNNVQVRRKDSNGNAVQSIKVPLSYGPKEKFLVRLDEQPDLTDKNFAITLPRMGFEIAGISYDPTRKLARVGKYKAVSSSDANRLEYMYNPVPYNIDINLYTFTATADAGLQIIEQILPYFQPDYTLTINLVPSMSIKRDVPIILTGINYEDSYTGNFTSRRAVIYQLTFTAKTYLYGKKSSQGVIKTVQADAYTDTTGAEGRELRITVEPSPTSASADDDFGFTTTITNYADGKSYDPVTDTDK